MVIFYLISGNTTTRKNFHSELTVKNVDLAMKIYSYN